MSYIDNNEEMIQEFGWLYKSWIHSGNWKTSDLIVVCHPEIVGQLPQNEPGVIVIPCAPVAAAGSVFEGYHFINSIACLTGPHVDPIARRYPFLLRTDADVFLTEHLSDARPDFPLHGRGLYQHSAAFRRGMIDFCERHGIEHMNHFGCGSSLFARADLVMHMLARQTYWTEIILKDFGDSPGTWPGWWRGVASMYAAEITANEQWVAYLAYGRERILDFESFSVISIDNLIYHIHALPTDDYFSKSKFRGGEYIGVDLASLDRSIVREYCHWIAASDTDMIKEAAGYLS
jgi:hypothetical protein